MNKNEQAKLYYMYMMADGEVSSEEKKLFSSICKELEIENTVKESIIEDCNKIWSDNHLSCIDLIKKNVEEDNYFYYGDILNLNLRTYDSEKASVLWNLINLGYADKCFTCDEKEVVDFLREYWEIEKSLYQEMIDVAETILSLEKHKKWVNDTISEYDLKRAKLNQIDKDIKFTQETIKTTIAEYNL